MGNDDNHIDDTGGILDNNTTETLNSGTDNNPTNSIVDTSDVEIIDTSATLNIIGGSSLPTADADDVSTLNIVGGSILPGTQHDNNADVDSTLEDLLTRDILILLIMVS